MNRDMLHHNDYLVVPNFVLREIALEMGEDFKRFCIENNVRGDNQSPQSMAVANYFKFVDFLMMNTVRVSRLTQYNLLPTYCYSRVYQKGQILHKHSDRESCEVSITICLDPYGERWPIFFTRPDGTINEVTLKAGDAVIYHGCRSQHWREACPQDEYTQLFIHYVKADGPFADHAFECFRKGLNLFTTLNVPVEK